MNLRLLLWNLVGNTLHLGAGLCVTEVGPTIREIAKETGVSKSTAHRRLAKAGFKKKRGGGLVSVSD